jgi:hypothetical protein
LAIPLITPFLGGSSTTGKQNKTLSLNSVFCVAGAYIVNWLTADGKSIIVLKNNTGQRLLIETFICFVN